MLPQVIGNCGDLVPSSLVQRNKVAARSARDRLHGF